MYPSLRRPLLSLCSAASFLALAAPGSAEPAGRCANETLAIDGQRILATFCIVDQKPTGSNKPIRVTISEALASPSGNVKRNTTLEFVAADPARAIDDIPLAALGIKKTLHTTLLYSYAGGSLKLEHALVVPGAVTVK